MGAFSSLEGLGFRVLGSGFRNSKFLPAKLPEAPQLASQRIQKGS